MLEGSRWQKNSFLLNLFRWSAKVSNVFLNVFSSSSLTESMRGTAGFSQNGAYDEQAFRYLLRSESKRSERSGQLYQVLLVYRTDAQRAIVPMDSTVAKTVIQALSRCLRETDYIGWYRDRLVVGGVLTVVGGDAVSDVSSSVQARLQEILRTELDPDQNGSLQIRVCQQHELEGVESADESFAAS